MNVRDIKKKVYKIDRQIVLEKCGTADCTPAAVTIEERIGWIPLWEMALDCGERCVRKIQWPVASKGAMPQMFWRGLYLPTCHHTRGSTELHGHKFAVCCFFFFFFWNFVYAFTVPPFGLFHKL